MPDVSYVCVTMGVLFLALMLVSPPYRINILYILKFVINVKACLDGVIYMTNIASVRFIMGVMQPLTKEKQFHIDDIRFQVFQSGFTVFNNELEFIFIS